MQTLENYLNPELGISLSEVPLEIITNNIADIVEYIKSSKSDKFDDALYLFNHLKSSNEEIRKAFIHLIINFNITYNQLPEHLKDTDYNFITGLYNPFEVLHDKKLLNNKIWLREALHKHPDFYKHVPKKIKNNDSFIHDTLKYNGKLFQNLEPHRQNDISFSKSALGNYYSYINIDVWNILPKKFTYNPDFIIPHVEMCQNLFKNLPLELRNNKNIYEAAILKYPYNLNFLNEELRNDIKLIQSIMDLPGFCLSTAGDLILNNPEFILSYLKKKPNDLFSCGDTIKNNKTIAKYMLSLDRTHLKGLSDIFKPYMSFFNEEIRNNKSLALLALKQDLNNMDYLPIKITNNNKIIFKYIMSKEYDIDILKKLNPELLKNPEIIIAILNKSPNLLGKLDPSLKNNLISFNQIIENCPDSSKIKLLEIFDFKENETEILSSYLKNNFFLNLKKEKSEQEYHKILQNNLLDLFYQNIMNSTTLDEYLNSVNLKNKLTKQLINQKPQTNKLKI